MYEMHVHWYFALDQDCAFGATLSHCTFVSLYGVVLERSKMVHSKKLPNVLQPLRATRIHSIKIQLTQSKLLTQTVLSPQLQMFCCMHLLLSSSAIW